MSADGGVGTPLQSLPIELLFVRGSRQAPKARKHLISEKHKRLILDFILGRIEESEFLNQFPLDVKNDPQVVVKCLLEAESRKDGRLVESVLHLGFTFGFASGCIPILCRLLLVDWHERQEDIISIFQKELPDPSAVEPLYLIATKEFPEDSILAIDNESYAVTVKCIWALYAIGTSEAKEKLELLALSPIEEISANAKARLSRMSASS